MSDTNIQIIKDKIDVAELVGEYVQLKRAGANFKGLCPFHSEKSPSFMVSRDRQMWHCFGCGKGGDIFSFIQEIEGMDFPEVLRFLANKAGVVLETYRTEINKSQKNRILEINIAALRFFYNFLERMSVADEARLYLKNRGLQSNTLGEWQIGYAPDQWDLLTKYLLKKGFAIDDLVASGLTIKAERADKISGRGFYDRFRGRIMFPIWDVHDNVVGFTGRILKETEHSGGKYVNTPQTAVYDKSNVVFGLNKAKQEIRKNNKVLVVEGQMDVITCHEAGMKFVVASSGTALTDKQIKFLKRYTENIVMCFDADAAGQNAAKRGIEIALQNGMNVSVVVIDRSVAKDPDECVRKNKEAWFSAVNNPVDVMEWYFIHAFQGKDLQNPKHKQQIVDELLQEILFIPKEVERDYWIQNLSARVGVDLEIIRNEAKRIYAEKVDSFKYKKELAKKTEPLNLQEATRLEKLLEEFLIIFFKFSSYPVTFLTNFNQDIFRHSIYAKLYESLIKEYNASGVLNLENLLNSLDLDKEVLTQILVLQDKGNQERYNDFDKDGGEKELTKIVANIENEWFVIERKKMQLELEAAKANKDFEKENAILSKLIQLFKKS